MSKVKIIHANIVKGLKQTSCKLLMIIALKL